MNLPEARWWRKDPHDRVVCGLCPRACALTEGERGYCGVRLNEEGTLRSAVSGRISGLQVDPVEKKPLYHFFPGAHVLSFGTVGCNLGCTFCQNWELSQTADLLRLEPARPEELAREALRRHCTGVAFTYNEPVVSAEYCLEVAQACREADVKTIAVTAGYVSGQGREDFFRGMDAANVDLKGFSADFYRRYCGARLEPVLETLEYLARETQVWIEITTLLIPGANDSEEELGALSTWVAENLGRDTPLHITAFHPDNRLLDRPPTPLSTLLRADAIARERGLRYVYLGNVRTLGGGTTSCPVCGAAVIVRDGYRISALRLSGGACGICGTPVPGRFVT